MRPCGPGCGGYGGRLASGWCGEVGVWEIAGVSHKGMMQFSPAEPDHR
ncbi:hypothetical protein JI435_402960 [Parastagonospora nodorum SN15]|uniref:Uncharacterized protein n=1 Tax=Phaeosphaeria nodorum (strain SN15 / ATCC MYA-4574 / FGSC 10173) TaxID=321614 RepID=A0A7U2HYJ0_PHANO|nr:hypothetical protein JI435_402960 [Parastagonospora nodorum SN15]